jgi:LAO/AO transport system kinase
MTRIEELVARMRKGDVWALARAVSLAENAALDAAELLSACFPFTGKVLRVGVTRSPGAGVLLEIYQDVAQESGE